MYLNNLVNYRDMFYFSCMSINKFNAGEFRQFYNKIFPRGKRISLKYLPNIQVQNGMLLLLNA